MNPHVDLGSASQTGTPLAIKHLKTLQRQAAVTLKAEELPRALNISPRLIDVLALLLLGWSNKLIARELALSVETVKQYVTMLLAKLGVASRAQVPMAVNRHHEALLAWDRARRERQAKAATAAPAANAPSPNSSSPSLAEPRSNSRRSARDS